MKPVSFSVLEEKLGITVARELGIQGFLVYYRPKTVTIAEPKIIESRYGALLWGTPESAGERFGSVVAEGALGRVKNVVASAQLEARASELEFVEGEVVDAWLK